MSLLLCILGKRLGKVAALFPVMYLSGGSCVMLIITGGGTMKLLFKTLCDNNHGETCNAHSLSGVEWFLVFTCAAILIAQLPNLNSMSLVSLIGAVAAITYCTLFWVLSVKKGRPTGVSYTTSLSQDHSTVAKISDILNAVGIIVLAFRGHNVLLEIQASNKYMLYWYSWFIIHVLQAPYRYTKMDSRSLMSCCLLRENGKMMKRKETEREIKRRRRESKPYDSFQQLTNEQPQILIIWGRC